MFRTPVILVKGCLFNDWNWNKILKSYWTSVAKSFQNGIFCVTLLRMPNMKTIKMLKVQIDSIYLFNWIHPQAF